MKNAASVSTSDPALRHDIEIFPHVIVRVGGGSFDELMDLEIDHGSALLMELRSARDERDSARQILGGEIFDAVGGRDDAGVRRALLASKRDLFNDRYRAVERLRGLPDVHLPSLSRYESAVARFDRSWKAFETAFHERQIRTRRVLQSLAADEAFQKPLTLSSRTLLDELPLYLSADPESLSAKQLHIERAVIKYVTRARAKTSPFSTFGLLALAELADELGAIWRCDGPLTFTSRIRISSIHWLKLRPLILAVRGIADQLRVRPNPTLEATDEGYKYLLNASNIESFRTLPPIDEFGRIADLAADSPTFTSLLNRVSSAELVEGDESDIRAFLRQLIAEGFLEFDAGISGSDPDWDLNLMSLLRPMAAEAGAAAEIIAALSELREQLRRFASAGLASRDVILRESHERLANLQEFLIAAGNSEPGDKKTEPPDASESPANSRRNSRNEQQRLLYEDAVISQPAIRINAPDLFPMVQALSVVTRHLSFVDNLTDERAQLTHYCVAKYGESMVPLMRIYEDYYRDCKVPEHRRKKESKTNSPEAAVASDEPFVYPGGEGFALASAERARAVGAWTEAIVRRLRHAGRVSSERVDIHPADLESASALLPGAEGRPVFGSTYLQLIAPNDRDPHYLGVVNGIAPGYGKMMSRFLDLFPDEVTELNRVHNRLAAGECRLAEVRDGSVSNANMHPPLLDFEVTSPGAQTSFPPDRQIPVSDLRVIIAASVATPLSLVRHSTGERVEVIDLGFLGLPFRAPLLQLLVHGFSRAKYIGYQPLTRAAAIAAGATVAVQPDSIVSRPRVVFDGRLVLQRRGWTVGREALPVRLPGESDASFYIKVNDWRESHGMPEQVFVYLTKERGAERKSGTKLSRDDYKPQFIDFQNWFTVDLFERMRARVAQSMFIEEMLPSANSMLPIGGKRYAAELIVQWSPRTS